MRTPHLPPDRCLRPSGMRGPGRSGSAQSHMPVQVHAAPSRALHLGIDFGTSGSRAILIDGEERVVGGAREEYSDAGSPDEWRRALGALLAALPPDARAAVQSLAIDGTSSTALLADRRTGQVLQPPKLYNEAQAGDAVAAAGEIAPPQHTATAATSTLCKLLAWHLAGAWQQAERAGGRPVLLHQADWAAGLLHGRWEASDWNNALKLGFDPGAEAYPPWLLSQEWAHLLPPRVLPPGSPVAAVTPEAAAQHGLPASCLVVAGTTDSNAAFLAAGVQREGEAVTSLGSSLAVKLLSSSRVDDAASGVYSHRIGDAWLVGGASNTGGAVLRSFFSDEQLAALTQRIDADAPSGSDFYPLLRPGERFPVNNPQLQPRLSPRPADDAAFLHGLLEGIARIEAQAYRRLESLGASRLTRVVTAGGGAKNAKWAAMRARLLGVPVEASAQTEAAYGAALLALRGWRQQQQQRQQQQD